jgi:carbon-monoxide dehydrogenase medium subunit
MYPTSFDYYRPKNLKEAITLLKKHKDAKLLAGGHSLLPAMKLRVSSPSALIDIARIKGLDAIEASKTGIKIGGMTTHASVESSKDVLELCPVLSETAGHIGDIQVRNRGTLGGSLAHADPAADYPTLMLALDADIVATGAKGKRKIAASKFFVDLFTTGLKAGEVLTSVSVPAMKAGQGACYLKHRHPASSYAVVGVAAFVTLKNGVAKDVRLAIGGVTSIPVLVKSIGASLSGQAPTASAIAEACESVPEALEYPLGDIYASGEYRTHLATVLSRRALTEAFARAKKQK